MVYPPRPRKKLVDWLLKWYYSSVADIERSEMDGRSKQTKDGINGCGTNE
jgi:hypothetical protein